MPTTYAIPNGSTAFAATTYTGNSGTIDTTYNFQPDMVWYKCRSDGATYHYIFDTNRGANNAIYPNLTSTENSEFSTLNTQSFITNGSRIVYNGGDHLNKSGRTYVNWSWKANGAAVTNTAGILTSQVSANTTAGFSVCTYTAPSSSQANSFGHGLGVAPSMVIAKNRSSGTGGLGWAVYHSSLGANQYLSLNSTAAASTSSGYWGSGMTSSVVGLPTCASSTGVDNCTGNMVAYCWTAIPGYSAFGSYTGNGSTDGPFVFTNMRPRFILIKRTDTAGFDWILQDTSRSTYNSADSVLNPNSSAAEQNGGGYNLDVLSNGFKLRNSGGQTNASGGSYVYACFAECPMKFANAR